MLTSTTRLGLVSKGTEVDFQTGANAYLYGTRFLSYLAYQYSPDKLVDWLRRADGTERYYAADFERVFGKSIESAWQDWIVWEREFQTANLAAVREHPITPVHARREARPRRHLTGLSEQGQDQALRCGALSRAGAVPHRPGSQDRRGAGTRGDPGRRALSGHVARLRR